MVFGTDDLVERLIDLAPHTRLLYPPPPPTDEEITEEVTWVMPGQPEPRPAQVGKEFHAQQFLIQHADKVVVYITGGEDGV